MGHGRNEIVLRLVRRLRGASQRALALDKCIAFGLSLFWSEMSMVMPSNRMGLPSSSKQTLPFALSHRMAPVAEPVRYSMSYDRPIECLHVDVFVGRIRGEPEIDFASGVPVQPAEGQRAIECPDLCRLRRAAEAATCLLG